jgi:S1-C subfamily serine protease
MIEKLRTVIIAGLFALCIIIACLLQYRNVNAGSAVSGTAFFINNDGYIATAAHVISGRKHFFILYKKKAYIAKLILVDKGNDLAILKTDVIPLIALPLTTRLSNGAQAGIYGYPGGTTTLVMTTGKYTYGGLYTTNVYAHFKSCHGNSGGPIINTSGQVIGMLQQGASPFYGICSYESFGISAKYIIQNLRYRGITVDTYDYRAIHTFNYWYATYKDSIVYIEASK